MNTENLWKWKRLLTEVNAHDRVQLAVLASPPAHTRAPRISSTKAVHDEGDAVRWAGIFWDEVASATELATQLDMLVDVIQASPVLGPIYAASPVDALIGWGFGLPFCVRSGLAVATAPFALALRPSPTRTSNMIEFWKAADDLDEALMMATEAAHPETVVAALTMMLRRTAIMSPNPYHHLELLRWAVKRSLIGHEQAAPITNRTS